MSSDLQIKSNKRHLQRPLIKPNIKPRNLNLRRLTTPSPFFPFPPGLPPFPLQIFLQIQQRPMTPPHQPAHIPEMQVLKLEHLLVQRAHPLEIPQQLREALHLDRQGIGAEELRDGGAQAHDFREGVVVRRGLHGFAISRVPGVFWDLKLRVGGGGGAEVVVYEVRLLGVMAVAAATCLIGRFARPRWSRLAGGLEAADRLLGLLHGTLPAVVGGFGLL